MRIFVALSVAILATCVPPGPTGPSGSSIQPDACGVINVSPFGRKAHAFLLATAELDRQSRDLDRTVLDACRNMATILGVSPVGDTKGVCNAVSVSLDQTMARAVKTEKRQFAETTPAVCTTDVDFAGGLAAQCEGGVTADVHATCEGSCSGSCNGVCQGRCAQNAGNGQCAGACDGTCRGTCTGDCSGYARVDASAECKASAELRAVVNTRCTKPTVRIVERDVTVIDKAEYAKANAAIAAGLGTILSAQARARLVLGGLPTWARAFRGLVTSAGDLVQDLGAQSLCVANQVSGALSAMGQIEARFSVSVEVSASIQASAGASR